MRRKASKCTAVAMLISSVCLYSTASRAGEIQDVLLSLDSFIQRHDSAGLVRLAAGTVGKDYWGIGAGQGPTDATSLRLRVLSARGEWLFDERGLLRGDVESSLGAILSQPEQDLVSRLNVNPDNIPEILRLMLSPDPGERWIGIHKTRFLTTIAPTIVQALRGIAANDEFVVLADIPIPATGPAPPPLHSVTREFVAPLRRLANEQLTKWNEQVPDDPQSVAAAGIRRLCGEYSARPERRSDILWAVSRLGKGYSPVAMEALRNFPAGTPQSPEVVNAFKQAAEAERPTP